MSPIFVLTLKKYLTAKSTYVILAFSVIIGTVLGGVLPFVISWSSTYSSNSTNYMNLSVTVVGSTTSFLSIFASIFAGFKAATMFKDEIEEGTFLMVISKPISRFKILLHKWFALQTINFFFSFISIGAFASSIAIFDKGHSVVGASALVDHLYVVAPICLAVLFLATLIFSSIALLVSTRISFGGTIAISTALGIIIPITGILSIMLKQEEYNKISKGELRSMHNELDTFDQTRKELEEINSREFRDKLLKVEPRSYHIFPTAESFTKQIDEIYKTMSEFDKVFNDKNIGLSNIASPSEKNNQFKNAWPFDINFQISQLASLSTDTYYKQTALNGNNPFQKQSGNVYNVLKDDLGTTATHQMLEMIKINNEKYAAFIKAITPMTFTLRELVGAEYESALNFQTDEEMLVAQKLSSLKDWANHYTYGIWNTIKALTSANSFGPGDTIIESYGDDYHKVYDSLPKQDQMLWDEIVATNADPNNPYPDNTIDRIKSSVNRDLMSIVVVTKVYPNYFVKIEEKSYVEKPYLLIAYGGLAAILLPISWLALRKQDFR